MVSKNKKSSRVAVITRTKNRNALLKRALESVQTQTFGDFIQVIVNDGGDPAVIDKLAAQYPADKTVLIHNKRSIGITKALNQGIQSIDSEYVAILDDDDTWDPDLLENAISFLDSSRAKGVVVIMDRIIENVEGDKITFVSKNRWLPEMEYISLYKQCLDNYLATNCFIYRREVYDELRGYDEHLGVAEDWDFGLRFLQKYDVELLRTEKPLAFYHHRPSVEGDVGNSVFAGVDVHRYHLNMLANKYLREDIKYGKMGVGYIINSLRYEQERDARHRQQDLNDIIRLEGHVNYKTEEVARIIVEQIDIQRDEILPRLIYTKLRKLAKKVLKL